MAVYENKNRVLERFGRSHPRVRYPLVENFEKKTLRLSPIRETALSRARYNNTPVLPPINPPPLLQKVNSPYYHKSVVVHPSMRPSIPETSVRLQPPRVSRSADSALRSPVRENFLPMHRGKRYSSLKDRPPFDARANPNGYIKSPVRKPYVPNMTPRSPIVRSPISRRLRSPSPNTVKESYRFMSRF